MKLLVRLSACVSLHMIACESPGVLGGFVRLLAVILVATRVSVTCAQSSNETPLSCKSIPTFYGFGEAYGGGIDFGPGSALELEVQWSHTGFTGSGQLDPIPPDSGLGTATQTVSSLLGSTGYYQCDENILLGINFDVAGYNGGVSFPPTTFYFEIPNDWSRPDIALSPKLLTGIPRIIDTGMSDSSTGAPVSNFVFENPYSCSLSTSGGPIQSSLNSDSTIYVAPAIDVDGWISVGFTIDAEVTWRIPPHNITTLTYEMRFRFTQVPGPRDPCDLSLLHPQLLFDTGLTLFDREAWLGAEFSSRVRPDCECVEGFSGVSFCDQLSEAVAWYEEWVGCPLTSEKLAEMLTYWFPSCEHFDICFGDFLNPTCTSCCNIYTDLLYQGAPLDPDLIDEAILLAGLSLCQSAIDQKNTSECPAGIRSMLRGAPALKKCFKGCSSLESSNSVHFSTGQKAETVTDLSIALTGADYTFVRRYTSGQPNTTAYDQYQGWLGSAWDIPSLPVIATPTIATKSDAPEMMEVVLSGRAKYRYELPQGFDPATEPLPFQYSVKGSNTEWLELFDAGDGGELDVRLVAEGVGDQIFTRLGDYLVIESEADLYGNVTSYDWTTIGGKPRPTAINLNGLSPTGGPDDATTFLQLEWHDDVANLDATGSPFTAVLSSAIVYRGPTTDPANITQRLDYYYTVTRGSTFGLLSPDGSFSGTGAHMDLGPAGSLVHVEKSVRMNIPRDDSGQTVPRFYKTAQQYRYYSDYGTVALADEDFEGSPDKLKLVIDPEQIEYVAQEFYAANPQTPNEDTVTAYARSMLASSDTAASFGSASSQFSVADIASKIIGYDPDQGNRDDPVSLQLVRGDCSCAGAGQSARRLEYEYFDWGFPWDGVVVPGRTMKMSESDASSGSSVADRIHYHDVAMLSGDPDSAMYLIHEVTEDPSTQDRWVTRYDYDDTDLDGNQLFHREAVRSPSACESYTPAMQGVAPDYEAGPSGYIEQFVYDAEGFVEESWVSTSYEPDVSLLTHGDPGIALIEKRSYATIGGVHRVTQIDRYTNADSATADDLETETYSYGLVSGSSTPQPISHIRHDVEAELMAENGPGGLYSSFKLFDPANGNLAWIRRADGGVSYFQYDDSTGKLTRTVGLGGRPGTAEPNGFYPALDPSAYGISGWQSDPLWAAMPSALFDRTEHRIDALGRSLGSSEFGQDLTRSTDAYMLRELATDSLRPGILYQRLLALPDLMDKDGNGSADSPATSTDFAGPVLSTWMNASGELTRVSEFEAGVGVTTTAYGADGVLASYDLGTELARSSVSHDLHGVVTANHRWPHLHLDRDGDGNPGSFDTTEAYTSSYTYDALGRVIATQDPNGTITENDVDVLDRITQIRVGTVSEVPVPVSDFEFDGGEPGDGNLTKISAYVDGNATPDRVTTMEYDTRNRKISTQHADVPHEACRYDNLDRIVEKAVYSSLPAINENAPLLTSGANRGTYTKTEYGQRGLPVRTYTLIDPALTTLTNTTLETNMWYDELGRTIATAAPDSPTMKTAYDGMGRRTRAWASAGDPTSHADASDIAGDTVLEQTYIGFDTRHRAIESTVLHRLHGDDTSIGALSHTTAVPNHTRTVFDDADRPVATLRFGSGGTGFVTGSPMPALPTAFDFLDTSDPMAVESAVDAVVAANGDQLVNLIRYSPRGLAEDAFAPRGSGSNLTEKVFATRTLYDDLSRPIATIENATIHGLSQIGNDSLIWDQSAVDGNGRWLLSLSSNPLVDEDRVTSFVYDGVGNQLLRTAHIVAGTGPTAVGEESQSTRFVYDASPSAPLPSTVANRGLLSAVIYPDETSGEPGSTPPGSMSGYDAEYVVQSAYNRQGELTARIDQNQTRHDLSRDSRGRVTSDSVTAFGIGVDQWADEIATVYDNFGRVDLIETLDGTTVLNSIDYAYTPFWKISTLIQDTDESGTGTYAPQTIEYVYPSTTAANTGNTYSLNALRYPGDSELTTPIDTISYTYGDTANDIDRLISRVSAMTEAGTTGLVKYAYAGVNTPVIIDYPSINIQQAYDLDPFASGAVAPNVVASNGYPSLDRHGRTLRHAWTTSMNAAAESDPLDSSRTTYPGAAVDKRHEYDLQSNRLHNVDQFSHIADRDWWHEYDGLNRLSTSLRGGGYDMSQQPVTRPGSRDWNLDRLGNWKSVTTDDDGDATFGGGSGQFFSKDTRSHNGVNEISVLTQSSGGNGQVFAGTAQTFDFDANGNLLGDGTPGLNNFYDPTFYTYDAWNRLTRVEREIDPTTQERATLGEYEYNGRNWRTLRRFDSSRSAPDGLDQQRAYFWSANWKLLEEHVEIDRDDLGEFYGDADDSYKSRQFWGVRYLDDAIAKRLDREDNGFEVAFDRLFYLTDAQFSVLALIREGTGQQSTPNTDAISERLSYTPYGTARHRAGFDFVTTFDQANDPPATGYYPNGVLDLADISFFSDRIQAGSMDADIAAPFGVLDLGDTSQSQQVNNPNTAPDGWLADPELATMPAGSAIGTDNAIGFTGHYFDVESGLYAARHRYYHPNLGRWMSRDSAGYMDGMSLYLYAIANPAGFVDPLGLFGWPWDGYDSASDWLFNGVLGANVDHIDPIEHPERLEAIKNRSFMNGTDVAAGAAGTYYQALAIGTPDAGDVAIAGTIVAGKKTGFFAKILGFFGKSKKGANAAEAASKALTPIDECIDLTDFRSTHILNRHRSGAGKPGKTEFPASWSDERILHQISDVAVDPDSITGMGKHGPYAVGTRDGIEIRVDFYPDDHRRYPGMISTAYPINTIPNPPKPNP